MRKMKKICMIGSGLIKIPPKYGGAVEKIIFELSKALSKDFEMIVIDKKNDRKDGDEKIEGVKFLRISSWKPKNKILLRISECCFGRRALLNVRRLKPDIVHLHTVFTALPFAVFRFLLSKNTKIVYTSHNPAWTVDDEELDFANKLIERIEAFVMKKVDKITAVSNAMKNGIVKKVNIPEDKITTIHNFVDIKKFSPRYGKAWKNENKIKGRIVLFVGKLIENKGIEYLIRAIPLVKEHISDVKFIFVGPTSFETSELDRKWLNLVNELNIKQAVIFTGAVSEDKLQRIYASADVFCLPTLREGFPVVILEAMASGLPIVASRISGVPEVVGDNGILIERKSVNAIANAIIKLLSNKKMMKKFSRNSRKIVKENFTVDKISKNYKKFYDLL